MEPLYAAVALLAGHWKLQGAICHGIWGALASPSVVSLACCYHRWTPLQVQTHYGGHGTLLTPPGLGWIQPTKSPMVWIQPETPGKFDTLC